PNKPNFLNFLKTSKIFILSSCLLFHQYHFVDQRLNWTEAQTYCRQKYTDLATIETSEEMDQLMETVSSAGYKSGFWIGLYIEINWRWSDGFSGSFTGNSYETSVNPSNCLSDQICMIVYWHSEHHHWSDSNCSSVFPFVCYNGKNFSKTHFIAKYYNSNL
uniref:C-type lectin domain-containing protein n=1 Tax=Oryzias melastigma TaxID=30732 RepID=A0A3B3CZ06_ORYME